MAVQLAAVFLCLFIGCLAEDKYSYVTKHIQVPVDHFSFSTNATFQLRYLVNDTWWKPQAPIFFYTGNEGDIEMFAQNTGFMWDIGPEFNAMVVFAEHRYYGTSMPFGNVSYSDPKHLGYLTSGQALADFVLLIGDMKGRKEAARSPVVAFGGSYGGMLAAWIRMKYPHVVAGAIAGSAPILQFPGLTPCDAFGRIVTSDFKSANPECSKSIRKSWSVIDNITSTAEGKSWLSSSWQLCSALKTGDDVKALKSWLADVYTNLAMVDYPYAANFLAPLPANPINAVCQHLTKSALNQRELLDALNHGVSVYTNYTRTLKCLDVKQNASPSLGDQGWEFQACTEMVMPMCFDGRNDMFEPSPWNFQQYSDDCFKKYGVRPDPSLIVQRFGGRDLSFATNIVFSNGLLDPWSSGGVLRNVSSSAVAIVIPEGAHHLDLRAQHPSDPQSVTIARQFHRSAIRTWIKQYSALFNGSYFWNSL